jgi:hypothetical protein
MGSGILGEELPNWAEAVSAVVAALTMLTVIFAVIQVTFLNRQIHRELEALYLQRYWALMDRRSERFANRGIPDRKDRSVIRAYLELSEDQLGLRSLGRVTDHTWRFWAKDISTQCQVASYRRELDAADSAEFPKLRALLSNGDKYDPLGKGRLWRATRGL